MKNLKRIVVALLSISIALSTFTGCSNFEKKKYLKTMEEKVSDYATELTSFASYLHQSKYGDAGWVNLIIESDEKLDSLGAEIKALKAAPGYESIQDKINQGIDKISEGTEIAKYVATKAKSKTDSRKYSAELNQAVKLFNQGGALFKEAANEL